MKTPIHDRLSRAIALDLEKEGRLPRATIVDHLNNALREVLEMEMRFPEMFEEIERLKRNAVKRDKLFGLLTLEYKKLLEQLAADRGLEFFGIVLERDTLRAALVELRRWVGDGDCCGGAKWVEAECVEFYNNAIAKADAAILANAASEQQPEERTCHAN